MKFSWNGLQITGTYSPGEPAQTHGDPDSYSPGWPPEFEIESAEVVCKYTFRDFIVVDEIPPNTLSIDLLDDDFAEQILEAATEHYHELRQDQLDRI